MLSATQTELCSNIVQQYDYYVVYYRYDYTDYTAGMERDYLIEIVCSDEKPEFIDGSYNFTDCEYYRVTENKYISQVHQDSFGLVPVSSADIVYTNALEGAPEICYIPSAFRNFDFAYYGVFIGIAFFSGCLVLRLLFGGKN